MQAYAILLCDFLSFLSVIQTDELIYNQNRAFFVLSYPETGHKKYIIYLYII